MSKRGRKRATWSSPWYRIIKPNKEAGLSNRAIADRPILAVGMVKRHVTNVHGKMRVCSRTQTIARAKEGGLFDSSVPAGFQEREWVVPTSNLLKIPHPHRQDIGVSLLTRLLNQAGISREEWETEE